MKQAEYTKAVNANDQPNIDLNNAALVLLKEDLAATVKAYNSVTTEKTNDNPKNPAKTKKWWQNFFPLKPATNRK